MPFYVSINPLFFSFQDLPHHSVFFLGGKEGRGGKKLRRHKEGEGRRVYCHSETCELTTEFLSLSLFNGSRDRFKIAETTKKRGLLSFWKKTGSWQFRTRMWNAMFRMRVERQAKRSRNRCKVVKNGYPSETAQHFVKPFSFMIDRKVS